MHTSTVDVSENHAALRPVYRWFGGVVEVAGSVSDAHLRAWEYELVSQSVRHAGGRHSHTVSLWRTRRPDLAPPELWIGDEELDEAQFRSLVNDGS